MEPPKILKIICKMNEGSDCFEQIWFDLTILKEEDFNVFGFDLIDIFYKRVVSILISFFEFNLVTLPKDYIISLIMNGNHPLLPIMIIQSAGEDTNDTKEIIEYIRKIYDVEELEQLMRQYKGSMVPTSIRNLMSELF